MRKKVKYVLGILTAGIFCGAVLAGCGGRKSLSARELAAETASNLEKIESYEGNVFLDLQAAIDMEEYGISSMEMNIGLDVNVQETMDPAAAAMYGSMDISMLGQQQKHRHRELHRGGKRFRHRVQLGRRLLDPKQVRISGVRFQDRAV